ncbi:hypothetical protein VTO42DRAFT_2877 [Malbranchea cinnamomea]
MFEAKSQIAISGHDCDKKLPVALLLHPVYLSIPVADPEPPAIDILLAFPPLSSATRFLVSSCPFSFLSTLLSDSEKVRHS